MILKDTPVYPALSPTPTPPAHLPLQELGIKDLNYTYSIHWGKTDKKLHVSVFLHFLSHLIKSDILIFASLW